MASLLVSPPLSSTLRSSLALSSCFPIPHHVHARSLPWCNDPMRRGTLACFTPAESDFAKLGGSDNSGDGQGEGNDEDLLPFLRDLADSFVLPPDYLSKLPRLDVRSPNLASFIIIMIFLVYGIPPPLPQVGLPNSNDLHTLHPLNPDIHPTDLTKKLSHASVSIEVAPSELNPYIARSPANSSSSICWKTPKGLSSNIIYFKVMSMEPLDELILCVNYNQTTLVLGGSAASAIPPNGLIANYDEFKPIHVEMEVYRLTYPISMSEDSFRAKATNDAPPVKNPMTICGDIHGQFHDLAELFQIGGKVPLGAIPTSKKCVIHVFIGHNIKSYQNKERQRRLSSAWDESKQREGRKSCAPSNLFS